MPEKDPTTYTLLTYIWVGLLAMGGGLVAFIRRLNEQKNQSDFVLCSPNSQASLSSQALQV